MTNLPRLAAGFATWAALAAAQPAFAADEKRPAPHGEKRELRVVGGPERGRLVLGRDDGPKETVAFLGVETGPVAAAVSAQLGLRRGTGLTVNHLVPKSPAAGVLEPYDILLKLDDQILIETRQLAVLIRGKKEGDEVTLTYLRGGKQATAKVKLGKHEVPKFPWFGADAGGGGAPGGGGPERFEAWVHSGEGGREELDRVLSLLGRTRGAPDGGPGIVPPPPRIRVERAPGPGLRAISVNTRNSALVYSDDTGTLDLTLKDGVKSLVAKDPEGKEIFSGPVTTPEERAALPAGVRERLEKLEGMKDVTFRTDGDVRVEERTLRPRGIALPLPGPELRREPLPRRTPAHF